MTIAPSVGILQPGWGRSGVVELVLEKELRIYALQSTCHATEATFRHRIGQPTPELRQESFRGCFRAT